MFPEEVPLPAGSAPEGIAAGPGHHLLRRRPFDGAIYRGVLRTGEGGILDEGEAGRVAVGMQYDASSGLLWVAGARTGTVTANDGCTGEEVYSVELGAGRFLNDLASRARPST